MRSWAGQLLVAVVAGTATVASAGAVPSVLGVYLWYPVNQAEPPTDDECRRLVDEVRPTRKKAEDWLWGRTPEGNGNAEFYLFLGPSRMEPTFSAEGDYDTGTVTYGAAAKDTVPFTLVPDDHPDTVILGTIVASPGHQVLTVTLDNIPLDGGARDRTTHYCRFAEDEMES
ncbi:MAG: hypothetical protein WAU16_01535 [Rhizobiaceae bacterium]